MTADLSQGLASLGTGIDALTSGIQGWQKRSALAELGDAIQSGDNKAAMAAAAKLGDTGTMMSLAKLGQAQQSAKIFNDQLPGLVGGLDGSQPSGLGGMVPPNTTAQASDSSSSPSVADASTPRGIRNNNPGNVEDGPFAKSQAGYAGSDGRFARYDTLDNGIGAQTSLIGSYGKRGINTVAGVVNRWAPAAENGAATGNYVNFVARAVGVDPNQPIDLSDPGIRTRLAGAMRQFENGRPVPGGGTQVASADPSFASQGGATAYAPTGSQGGGADTGGNPDDAAKAIAANSSDPKAVATATYLTARPSGSSERITRLAKLAALPGLGEGQQKIVSLLLQKELDSGKQPDAVKQFLFAKTAEGGGFQGTFADFQKKSQDRGDTIESAITARAKLAPQYGLQPGTAPYQQFVLNGKVPEQAAPEDTTGVPQGVDPQTYRQEQAKKIVAAEKDATDRNAVLQSAMPILDRAERAYRQLHDAGKIGPLNASSPNRIVGGIFGTQAEIARQEYEAAAAELQLLQGQIKMKGQGSISDSERRLLALTLPKLDAADGSIGLSTLQGFRQQFNTAAERPQLPGYGSQAGSVSRGSGIPQTQPSVAAPPPRMTMPSLEGGGVSTPMRPRAGALQPQGQPGAQAAPASQQAAGSQPPVRVSTPQEAASLPSGTTFLTPDGRLKVRP